MFERLILRAFCEGWDTTALHPKPFPAHSACPTLRKEHEGWGTSNFVEGKEERKRP
jgi:hypothetical protein